MPYSEATDNVPLMLGITADPVAAPVSAPLERVASVTPQAVLFPAAPPAAGAYLVEPSSVRRRALPGRPAEGRRPGLPLVGDVLGGATRRARSSCRRRRGRGWCSQAASKETGLPVYATDDRAEGRGLPAQAGHARRADPRRQQHAGRLADVAARPARGRLQGRLRGRLLAAGRALRHDPDARRHLAVADRQRPQPEHGAGALPLGARRRHRPAGTRSPRSCAAAARWSRSAPPATPPRRC